MTGTDTCQTCKWWHPYTTLLSHDGLEFRIGHCEPWTQVQENVYTGRHCGLTADNYGCNEHKPVQ